MADEIGTKDWIGETVRCFFSAENRDEPADPVAAIQRHFDRVATDALKASCAEQGKTAEKCWKFVSAVARHVLHNRSGHIAPDTVYAIAMHWFQDVPVDWNKSQRGVPEAAPTFMNPKPKLVPEEKPAAETPKPAMPKVPKAERKRKPKPSRQEFFFELMETQEGGADAQSVES